MRLAGRNVRLDNLSQAMLESIVGTVRLESLTYIGAPICKAALPAERGYPVRAFP
jgi:hypothetical protein